MEPIFIEVTERIWNPNSDRENPQGYWMNATTQNLNVSDIIRFTENTIYIRDRYNTVLNVIHSRAEIKSLIQEAKDNGKNI